MPHVAPTQPFRWDVSRREGLGSLVADADGGEELWFLYELKRCAALVLARSADARRLYFVGRSPLSIFDLLSGALAGTTWRHRLALLPFSMRYPSDRSHVLGRPRLHAQLRSNLSALGLHPDDLQRTSGAVAFVDLVAVGGTFGNLLFFLRRWARETGAQWDVVGSKLRWIGVTGRVKPGPNTWRWHQSADWVATVPRSTLVSVSIDWPVWCHLGNDQHKVTRSFPYDRWLEPDGPRRDDHARTALATAVRLYEHGRTPGARERLVHHMRYEPAFTQAWLRSLALELRQPMGRAGRS